MSKLDSILVFRHPETGNEVHTSDKDQAKALKSSGLEQIGTLAEITEAKKKAEKTEAKKKAEKA